MDTLVLTTKHVFDMLTPDTKDIPKKAVLDDVTIQIQAFIFNVFGAIDNLAWCWLFEKGVKQDNNREVPASWVGLSPDNTFFIATLSTSFREYILELREWFHVIKGYRHGLAHRIPLYIPPYVVPTDSDAEYQELDAKVVDAFSRKAWDEVEAYKALQLAMCVFYPHMIHSLEENKRTIAFHAQMIADFGLVEDLGGRMLHELKSI